MAVVLEMLDYVPMDILVTIRSIAILTVCRIFGLVENLFPLFLSW